MFGRSLAATSSELSNGFRFRPKFSAASSNGCSVEFRVGFHQIFHLMLESLVREVEVFLSALRPGTRYVYARGLAKFQEFLACQGLDVAEFLKLVEEDLQKLRLEKTRVACKTLNAFIGYLQNEGFAPKSINTYVGAVQSLARYYDIPLSMRYVGRSLAKALN